jgi:hypothetical protein
MTFEIHVTPWATPDKLPNDLSAPMHDCLWEIAQEQAVLKRMKDTRENWTDASGKVSQQDVRAQLDVICDDNGFRRIDGSGNGRNPDLIGTNEPIKVRIDPNELNVPAPGVVEGQPSMAAYNKAVEPSNSHGVDLNEKGEVDAWVSTVPGFPQLPETTKAGLITAHGEEGVDPKNLTTLAGSQAFIKLNPAQQQQLLESYSIQPVGTAAREVDKIAVDPASEGNHRRLELLATPGFFKMHDNAQKFVLDRYSNDPQFRGAIDRIVSEPDFQGKNEVEQAHALDILARYTQRKGSGYGLLAEEKRTDVLVGLYNEVLSSADFNLRQVDRERQDTDAQRAKVDAFAGDRALDIAGVEQIDLEEYAGSTD